MYQVIGFKRSEFKPADSNDYIRGYNLYLVSEQSGVVGHACERIFVTDSKIGSYTPAVNDTIELTYNRFGKVNSVILV